MSEAAHIDLSGDQASGLRRLFGARAPQVVAFVSGSESCGRTTVVVQTAAALGAAGHSVVVVDENAAPHNATSAFGVKARYDLMHAIVGECSLRQVTLPAAPLVKIVPAAAAAQELDHADADTFVQLAGCLQSLQRGAGFVLVDCAASRGGYLSALALASRHLAIVVAAHGSSITHAYAMIKHMAQVRGREGFQVVITQARTKEEARSIFDNMKRVAREHLGVRLGYLGASIAPATEHIAHALATRLPTTVEGTEYGGFVFPKPLANVRGSVVV